VRTTAARPQTARPFPRLRFAAGLAGGGWGKYGIIREGDMYTKQEEFLSWLADVKVGTHYTHPLYSLRIHSLRLYLAWLHLAWPSSPLTSHSPLAGRRV
jgi:hypothetical protein